MRANSVEQFRAQPTVVGAVRRYGTMVVLAALLGAVLGVGYSLVQTEVYRATATVTAPQQVLAEGVATDQGLDGQVVLLQSEEVARRAVRIVNRTLGGRVVGLGDFSGDTSALEVTPPEGTTPGAYGATIITVSYTGPSARIAQVAANAVLHAFEDLRYVALRAQGRATLAGIDEAIQNTENHRQRRRLFNQRTQAEIDLQANLASEPTIAWAVRPQQPINGNSKLLGGVGLIMGSIAGAALAFLLASRRRSFDGPLGAEALYAAPLLGEIPKPEPAKPMPGVARTADPLPMATDPLSPVAEACRFVARPLENQGTERTDRTVALVSPRDGGGRSAVVANVALALAESGSRVLAVDADDRAELTGLLRPDKRTADGFQQVLAGRRATADCAGPSSVHDGVEVLWSGPPLSDRLTGRGYAQAVRKVLDEVRGSFDVVLIDCPGVLRRAEATELLEASDAVAVVVDAEDPIEDHAELVERLSLTSTEVRGYVYCSEPPPVRFVDYVRSRVAARLAGSTRGQAGTPAPVLHAVSTEGDEAVSAGSGSG
ncbi:MAG TPA: AAA family ATPase [Nocardioidaceae bacterium]